jgi:hypothetical protein
MFKKIYFISLHPLKLSEKNLVCINAWIISKVLREEKKKI